MDPNEALRVLRAWAADQLGADYETDTDQYRAAEQFDALDHWLIRGGFKPRDWRLTVDQVDGVSKVVARS